LSPVGAALDGQAGHSFAALADGQLGHSAFSPWHAGQASALSTSHCSQHEVQHGAWVVSVAVQVGQLPKMPTPPTV
jgi:hypothetical protein